MPDKNHMLTARRTHALLREIRVKSNSMKSRTELVFQPQQLRTIVPIAATPREPLDVCDDHIATFHVVFSLCTTTTFCQSDGSEKLPALPIAKTR